MTSSAQMPFAFQLQRFIKSASIRGTRAVCGFRILRRSAKCTRRPNLKAAQIPVLSVVLAMRCLKGRMR